jgi:hypothetical protein
MRDGELAGVTKSQASPLSSHVTGPALDGNLDKSREFELGEQSAQSEIYARSPLSPRV